MGQFQMFWRARSHTFTAPVIKPKISIQLTCAKLNGFRSRRPPSLRESAEETFRLPLRGARFVRNPLDQRQEECVELRRSGEIDGLIHIVSHGMIPIPIPGAENFLFRAPGNPAEFKRQRGNALLDEAVLVAADKAIRVWIFVSLNLYP